MICTALDRIRVDVDQAKDGKIALTDGTEDNLKKLLDEDEDLGTLRTYEYASTKIKALMEAAGYKKREYTVVDGKHYGDTAKGSLLRIKTKGLRKKTIRSVLLEVSVARQTDRQTEFWTHQLWVHRRR